MEIAMGVVRQYAQSFAREIMGRGRIDFPVVAAPIWAASEFGCDSTGDDRKVHRAVTFILYASGFGFVGHSQLIGKQP